LKNLDADLAIGTRDAVSYRRDQRGALAGTSE
jgi:hypothetical protein